MMKSLSQSLRGRFTALGQFNARWLFSPSILMNRKGGFVGDLVGWFIRVVIYDICVTLISDTFGVSRIVALFIFLGILGVIGFVLYLLRRKMSPGVDDPI